MITVRGAGWFFLTVLVGAALAYSGFKPLQFVFILMIILPLCSLCRLILIRSRTQIVETLSQHIIQRGHVFSFCAAVQTRSPVLLGAASVTLQQTGSDQYSNCTKQRVLIDTRKDVQIRFPIRAVHCGLINIQLTELTVVDLFGFFRISLLKRLDKRSDSVISVLPGSYPFVRLDLLQALMKENPAMMRWQAGSDLDTIADIRQQQPGDALKRAHWKLSARLNEIMIREFENPIQPEVVIIDDSQTPAFNDHNKSEQYHDFTSECLVYLSFVFLKQMSTVRLIAWRHSIRETVVASTFDQKQLIQFLLCEPRRNANWQSDQLLEDEMKQHPEAALLVWSTCCLTVQTALKLVSYHTEQRPLVCLILYHDDRHRDHEALEILRRASIRVIEAAFDVYQKAVQNKTNGWDEQL
jgi:hypothetical protein